MREDVALHREKAYYGRLRDVWPPDMEEAFDNGTIDLPLSDDQ